MFQIGRRWSLTMSSLLDYARENPIEYEPERYQEYLKEFKKADQRFRKYMGWSGPRTLEYSSEEMINYCRRVLAEAYDNDSINFEDALVGYMLVIGGAQFEKIKRF